MKLFVIAGHGAGDPGATANGFQESERVRALATKMKEFGGNDVMLGGFNRNYYADNGISKGLGINKSEYEVIELHLDSAASTAKGGHIIIQSGIGGADSYDRALASMLGEVFPGRSNLIVERNDLANTSRAALMGYSYRLMECCFISNADDIKKFNSILDDLAKRILTCFGIATNATPQANNVTLQKNIGADNQRWMITHTGDYTKLKNKKTGFYLDLAGASTKNETNVQVYKENGTDAQLWKIVRKSHGEADYILLEPKLAKGKYLSVGGNNIGGNIKLYEDLKNSKQKFYLRQESDGCYIIIHAHTAGAITAS